MEHLRKQLTELINNSQLPAECIFYIFKDVYRDLQEQYVALLNSQAVQQVGAEEISSQPQDLEEVNE